VIQPEEKITNRSINLLITNLQETLWAGTISTSPVNLPAVGSSQLVIWAVRCGSVRVSPIKRHARAVENPARPFRMLRRAPRLRLLLQSCSSLRSSRRSQSCAGWLAAARGFRLLLQSCSSLRSSRRSQRCAGWPAAAHGCGGRGGTGARPRPGYPRSHDPPLSLSHPLTPLRVRDSKIELSPFPPMAPPLPVALATTGPGHCRGRPLAPCATPWRMHPHT
jgi:hypothetical protein